MVMANTLQTFPYTVASLCAAGLVSMTGEHVTDVASGRSCG